MRVRSVGEPVERGVHESRQRLEVVAALEHRGERGASPRQRRASVAEAVAGQLHRTRAGRRRARRSRPRRAAGRARSRATAGSTSSSKARRYSSLPEPAGSGTFTRRLVALAGPAGAGVEGPLVERDVEDGRVVPEDRLRPVAVVDVPVDDRDALEAELGLGRPGGDGHVVEEAKAHRAVGRRVVAGRPDEREAAARRGLDRTRRRRAARPRSSSPRRACPRRARSGRRRSRDAGDVPGACGSARPARRWRGRRPSRSRSRRAARSSRRGVSGWCSVGCSRARPRG